MKLDTNQSFYFTFVSPSLRAQPDSLLEIADLMIITNGLQNPIVILSLNIRQRIQHIDPSLKNHRSIEMSQYIRRYYYWLFCIVVVFF